MAEWDENNEYRGGDLRRTLSDTNLLWMPEDPDGVDLSLTQDQKIAIQALIGIFDFAFFLRINL